MPSNTILSRLSAYVYEYNSSMLQENNSVGAISE